MDHLAILNKKRKLLAKIISGEKRIESRWYKFRRTPFNIIKEGESVYFKESGGKVKVKAVAKKVLFFKDLNKDKIKEILETYGKEIGVGLEYLASVKDKRYCTLIFLDKVENIGEFKVNKAGYGNVAAWISVDNIEKLKA